jgi:hypothetical protein
MIDPSFRKALLEQGGETSMESRLTVLDDLVKADRQHIHRLTIWTIVGWAVCVTILALSFRVPIVMVVLFSFPFVGVVLLIIAIASRRSATMSQIQASLASIDAQLKLIQSQKTPPNGP